MSHDFEAIRAEFELPGAAESNTFPELVEAEAKQIAAELPLVEEDATGIPFVTIDPPGARDLDQAMFLERVGDGFRVHYAIADLGIAIPAGGAVDTEARRRGQTIYLPDVRVPLHPPTLSEGVLSLLPGQLCRAALWTIEVDSTGKAANASVRRALVKSIAQLDYDGVQAAFDAKNPHPSIEALAELGSLRRSYRVGLGAIELGLPEQEIVRAGDSWRLRMRTRTEVDGWNAEISLLTGMCAADLMLAAGIGILRTLPAAHEGDLKRFRRSAKALGVDWPEGATAAQVLVGLDPELPASVALMSDATRLLRGAGYQSFDSAPPAVREHAGVGGPYAHVTAPLRRLADRFGTEVALAICAGTPVPAWVRQALPLIGDITSGSDRLASKVDRACADQVEIWMLAGKVGQTFEAFVLRANENRRGGEVVLRDPPVIADCAGEDLPEGKPVKVRLLSIDAATRSAEFALV